MLVSLCFFIFKYERAYLKPFLRKPGGRTPTKLILFINGVSLYKKENNKMYNKKLKNKKFFED
jgi:hypothetical protein